MIAIAIGVWILPRAWHLAGRALRIVMQAAPPGLDLDAVAGELSAIDEVINVHDLHVWTLTSDMEVASAHLRVADGSDSHGVLDSGAGATAHPLSDRPRHAAGRADRPHRLLRGGVVIEPSGWCHVATARNGSPVSSAG